MIFIAVLLCCLGALVSSAPQKVFYNVEDAQNHFENFVQKYNKTYKSEEERQERFEIFKNNLVKLNELNKNSTLTIHGINMFTDLTYEEFNAKYNGLDTSGSAMFCQRHVTANKTRVAAPEAFDWRDQKKVTPVKNQLTCSACWAFASVANIEGQYAIKHNKLVEFSEQQLLECSKHTGCSTGYFITNAILDTIANPGGIMTEQEYPFTLNVGQCRAQPDRLVAKVTNCLQFVHATEDELKETLVSMGPIAIAIDAHDWGTPTAGIFQGCRNKGTNHAVLLVGYGSEYGVPYWIIKNSYGEHFGEKGYIRIPMYKNACNIMNEFHVTAVVA